MCTHHSGCHVVEFKLFDKPLLLEESQGVVHRRQADGGRLRPCLLENGKGARMTVVSGKGMYHLQSLGSYRGPFLLKPLIIPFLKSSGLLGRLLFRNRSYLFRHIIQPCQDAPTRISFFWGPVSRHKHFFINLLRLWGLVGLTVIRTYFQLTMAKAQKVRISRSSMRTFRIQSL